MKIPDSFVGKWRIIHTDECDQDFVDLIATGHITIRKDGTGGFLFGAVQGEMDCRLEDVGGSPVLGFTWDGSDENDPASGRGWVKVDGKRMEGHLYFHLGDDSAFKARRCVGTGSNLDM